MNVKTVDLAENGWFALYDVNVDIRNDEFVPPELRNRVRALRDEAFDVLNALHSELYPEEKT